MVTGANGAVGSGIVDELRGRGVEVVAIDRQGRGRSSDETGAWVFADLRRRETFDHLLAGVGAVVHFGELSNARSGLMEQVLAENATICGNVLTAAQQHGVRQIVYASTAQTYGFCGKPFLMPESIPVTERHPQRGGNVYAVSKINNERMCRFFAERFGLSVAALRMPAVVSGHSIRWLKMLWHRPATEVPDLGCAVAAADVNEAVARLLAKPVTGFEAFNIAGPDLMTPHSFAELVAAAPEPDAERWHGSTAERPTVPAGVETLMSTDKLFAHLDWRPQRRVADLVAAEDA